MEKVRIKQSHYQICHAMGTGVTSEVYRAFRIDADGITKQEVALKILKSKNDVQTLKREFESLKKLRSPHCANLIAWESLDRGPALVLEFIDGVTLEKLVQNVILDRGLLFEMATQICRGLKDLAKHGVHHGDLNLKNIMITRQGDVKLIDFGFMGQFGEQLYTPEFSHPSRERGGEPNFSTDLYSLQKIVEHLTLRFSLKKIEGLLCQEPANPAAKMKLGEAVQQCLSYESPQTKISQKLEQNNSPQFLKKALGLATFFLIFFLPLIDCQSPQFSEITLRSEQWMQYSINGLPLRSAPLQRYLLRSGSYQLHVKTPKGERGVSVSLGQNRSFSLQPENNLL